MFWRFIFRSPAIACAEFGVWSLLTGFSRIGKRGVRARFIEEEKQIPHPKVRGSE
jgi:hypothetical protein